MMKRLLAAAVAVAVMVILLAGCGSTVTRTVTLRTVPAAACAPGASVMGCSVGAQAQPVPPPPSTRVGVTAPVAGCIFPDVSYAQGYIAESNWATASKYICAAVAKAGESGYGEDDEFAHNITVLRALHIPWGAYYFVRSCTSGTDFVRILNSVGFKNDRDALVPDLDMEVKSAYNCAVPIADAVHKAFGVWPDIYTAPGTWPGGSSGGLDVWEADYTLAAAPESLPFAATVLAWQRYSPPYIYRLIPGLGYLDVSIDLKGFSKQLAFPAPKPPVETHTTTTPTSPPIPPLPPTKKGTRCFGRGSQQSGACIAIQLRERWLVVRSEFWRGRFFHCIRYAEGIGCDHAWHWFRVRENQAASLKRRYS